MKNNIFLKLSVKNGEFIFPAKVQQTRLNTFFKKYTGWC